jgi:hypothetical protein
MLRVFSSAIAGKNDRENNKVFGELAEGKI